MQTIDLASIPIPKHTHAFFQSFAHRIYDLKGRPMPVSDLFDCSLGKSVDFNVAKQSTDTESIVQELLSQGLSIDDIVMPGGAKHLITYIADDFNAPLDDFEEYL